MADQGILPVEDLRSYFLERLREINHKSPSPLPPEFLLYSSSVLQKYSVSEKLFEFTQGKVREKLLGLQLLEATQKPFTAQKILYQDIGDTALFLCGYFAQSLNQKVVDWTYYLNLGRLAYRRLDAVVPEAYEHPSFFLDMAGSLSHLVRLLSILASNDQSDPYRHIILDRILKDQSVDEGMAAAVGIVGLQNKKEPL